MEFPRVLCNQILWPWWRSVWRSQNKGFGGKRNSAAQPLIFSEIYLSYLSILVFRSKWQRTSKGAKERYEWSDRRWIHRAARRYDLVIIYGTWCWTARRHLLFSYVYASVVCTIVLASLLFSIDFDLRHCSYLCICIAVCLVPHAIPVNTVRILFISWFNWLSPIFTPSR